MPAPSLTRCSFKLQGGPSFDFPINPENIREQQGVLGAVTQLADGNYFIDSFGLALKRITLSGTTGSLGRDAIQQMKSVWQAQVQAASGIIPKLDFYQYPTDYVVTRSGQALTSVAASFGLGAITRNLQQLQGGGEVAVVSQNAGFDSYQVWLEDIEIVESIERPFLYQYTIPMVVLQDNKDTTSIGGTGKTIQRGTPLSMSSTLSLIKQLAPVFDALQASQHWTSYLKGLIGGCSGALTSWASLSERFWQDVGDIVNVGPDTNHAIDALSQLALANATGFDQVQAIIRSYAVDALATNPHVLALTSALNRARVALRMNLEEVSNQRSGQNTPQPATSIQALNPGGSKLPVSPTTNPVPLTDPSGAGGYVVVQGDDLRTIARKVYGDPGWWVALARLNGLTYPYDLSTRVGTRLRVSDTSPIPGNAPSAPLPTRASPAMVTTHAPNLTIAQLPDPTQARQKLEAALGTMASTGTLTSDLSRYQADLDALQTNLTALLTASSELVAIGLGVPIRQVSPPSSLPAGVDATPYLPSQITVTQQGSDVLKTAQGADFVATFPPDPAGSIRIETGLATFATAITRLLRTPVGYLWDLADWGLDQDAIVGQSLTATELAALTYVKVLDALLAEASRIDRIGRLDVLVDDRNTPFVYLELHPGGFGPVALTQQVGG